MAGLVPIGVMLYGSMPERPIAETEATLFVGVVFAVLLLWVVPMRRVIDYRVVPAQLGGLLHQQETMSN